MILRWCVIRYSISHPSGDVKKMGIFGGIAVPEGYFTAGDSHWFVAAWDAARRAASPQRSRRALVCAARTLF